MSILKNLAKIKYILFVVLVFMFFSIGVKKTQAANYYQRGILKSNNVLSGAEI